MKTNRIQKKPKIEISIKIKTENYNWLKKTTNTFNNTPEEVIEKLVNQKIEENMRKL
ncbi:MAG: hypothetical protein ACFFG0_09605 [Candidatus Thorarchaeota archaeon]